MGSMFVGIDYFPVTKSTVNLRELLNKMRQSPPTEQSLRFQQELKSSPYYIFSEYYKSFCKRNDIKFNGCYHDFIYVLLSMLKYAMVDVFGNVFIFMDEYQRKIVENDLRCSRSTVYLHLHWFDHIGLLTHTPPNRYELNKEFWRCMLNFDIDLKTTCRLSLDSLNHEKIDIIFSENEIMSKYKPIFDTILTFMIKFNNKDFSSQIEEILNGMDIYYKPRPYQPKAEFRKKLQRTWLMKNNAVEEDNSKSLEKLKESYSVLIAPQFREVILKEAGLKKGIFNNAVSLFCSVGLLKKVSAYRFLLNPVLIKSSENLPKADFKYTDLDCLFDLDSQLGLASY